MKNEFTNGRKKGCGACGDSESNELMQFNGIVPTDGQSIHVRSQVSGTRHDITAVLSMASTNLDKKLAKERQMEAILD